MAALAGCRDDLLEIDRIGEGESNVAFEMEFEPMYTALDNSRAVTTGGTPGNAINSINSLTVLCYKTDGTLYKVWRAKSSSPAGGSGDFNYTLDNNEEMPPDFMPNDTVHQAEAKTPKAHFSITGIPFGRYRFYAVANVDITDAEAKDIENVKEKSLTWDSGDIAANNAMFGFFSNDRHAGVRPQGFEADLVTLKESNTSLWAWIKRTVSKVTVAFDARKLNDNITIYIKDVQIRDIPKTCTLGKDNTPVSMDELENKGASIVYSSAAGVDPGSPAQVSRGNPIYGAAGNVSTGPDGKPLDAMAQIQAQHGELTPALYFFENMQGKGKKGTESDKRQDVNGNNKQVSYPNGNDENDKAFKDAKKYGTYIEVHAYYSNTSSGRTSQGDIIYRFMLGQDDVTDYDAMRNRHYKLTLCFNGNANDVDWHIVYTEPEVNFPVPYYLSYLYNHRTLCPVTIKTGKRKIKKITAEITSNNWAPMDAPKDSYWSAMDLPEQYPFNGFLSLKKTKQTVISGSLPLSLESNKPYYIDNKRNIRVYEHFEPNGGKGYNDDGSEVDGVIMEDDRYYVDRDEDKDGNYTYHLSLPMYSRAKQLIKETGYTGNNPYVAYRRQGKVKLIIELDDGTKITPKEELVIWQMRRVVNPKGIFREANSTKPFHVTLKILEGEESTSFTPLRSLSGPWKAYVVRASGETSTGTDGEGLEYAPSDPETTADGRDMISFAGGHRVYNANSSTVSDTVYGLTGSLIDFDINFKGTAPSGKSRFAVVRVEYNNESCYHLIYIRQGSAPVRLLDGEAKWHIGNLIASGKEATTPIDEGSLFKFGRVDWPIESRSNTNGGAAYVDGYRPWNNWINLVPDDFKKNNGTNLYIYGKTDRTYNWGDIPSKSCATVGNSFGSAGVSGARIAEFRDYFALLNSDDIELGYGVMYGDDASGTGTTLEEVYGYYTHQPTSYGIRGAFLYNKKNGTSIFLPIGNSGYGHRKDNGVNWNGNQWPAGIAGLLRYSCNARWGFFDAKGGNYPQGTDDAPLFYDIYRRPGAIYWFGTVASAPSGAFPNDTGTQNGVLVGWDINYFSFDYYPIASSNVGDGKDACFVRCVSD